MTNKTLTFSVTVCAFTDQRWETFVATIQSLRNQTRKPHEIILVIDHNKELFQRVQSYTKDMDNVMVVENQETQGVSGGRNTAVSTATGDVIAFLDDDAVAAPDWLEKLSQMYQWNDVIGVGGSIEPVWVDGRPPWFPDEFNWVYGCTYRGMPEYRWPVQRLIGCNMSIRRAAFDTIGLFCSDYGRVGNHPWSGEETELFIRLYKAFPQHILVYDPAAKVQHYMPAHRACWAYFRSRCFFEGIVKSILSRLVGVEMALQAEWAYTFVTLPKGILRGIGETILQRDPYGVARSATIVVGLGITAVGYVCGTVGRILRILPVASHS